MLYDQALLAMAYIEAFQATGEGVLCRYCKEHFYLCTKGHDPPEGGFYSAEDADSEGVEGKFYVWTPDEIIKYWGEKDGKIFCDFYDVSKEGTLRKKHPACG